MALNEIDKIKVRTATKCYLYGRNSATAREIHNYIMNLNLGLRGNLTVNNLAKDLSYCCKSTSRNLLDISYEVDNANVFHYFLNKR